MNPLRRLLLHQRAKRLRRTLKRKHQLRREYESEGIFLLPRDFYSCVPTLDEIEDLLGELEVTSVRVPHDCSDGFLGAYWRRPEAYLDPGARGAISSFARIPDPAPGLERLRTDLESGEWERRNAALLEKTELDIGYRLLVAECA